MNRYVAILYGAISYALFLAVFVYAIGFVGGLTPRSIDDAVAAPVGVAVVVDVLLMTLFAAQHSVMARPGFKKWWTRYVPTVVERSTYVLLASSALALLMWQWRSIPAVVWDIDWPPARVTVWTLFWLGWGIVLASTFMINHFELFGLRQVFNTARSQARDGLPDDALLSRRAPSAEPGLHRRILGGAHDDGGAPALRHRHDWLDSAGDTTGGTRLGGVAGRALLRVP
jgi:protein-S-isoprenylcysteine O-methyltransferase Ste14